MISADTMPQREATGLDATDELPALDVTAYEAQVAAREAAAPPESGDIATGSDGSATEPPDDRAADPAPAVANADVMLEVERWIVRKTEELRAQQAELRAARRERTAGAARADPLSPELGATTANLEALQNRTRILEDELRSEREAAQRRATEVDEAQREAARLGEDLTAARAAEARQSAELADSAALLQQRSAALETLQTTHAALVADRQRAADALSELETRLEDSEARARNAQHAIEAQSHAHTELVERTQDETRMRERLAAEHELLRAQLASCVEQLQSREAYRTICESTILELEDELAGDSLRAEELERRVHQLGTELEVSERRLQDALRERDEARRSHDTAVAQQAIERNASEQTRSAMESRLTELTTEHDNARARLLAMEATLTDTRRRAEAEALANGTAAERVRQLEAQTAALERELADARLEITRGHASLSDVTAALERGQTLIAEQTRTLEEREWMARSMATSHAELVALIATLRGQIEELTARLATPAEERRALEERVAALTKEAADSHSGVARLESTNVELRATAKQPQHASLAERDAQLRKATRIASTNAYALDREQSSFNDLSRSLTAADGAPPAVKQASILTRVDGARNDSFVLRARTTIGRTPDNDLTLAMGSVSRHHAVLFRTYRGAFLQDLGSANGVLVNKRRIRCVRLEHGDVITLGEAEFRYTVAPLAAVSGSQVPARQRAQR